MATNTARKKKQKPLTRLTLSPKASRALAEILNASGEAKESGGVILPFRKNVSARVISRKPTMEERLSAVHELYMQQSTSVQSNRMFTKAAGSSDESYKSNELNEANDQWTASVDDYLPTPYSMQTLATLLTINVMHGACIEAKSRDAASNGYTVVKAPGAEDINDELWDKASRDADLFLRQCTYSRMWQGAPIDVLLHALATDYNSLGCANYEPIRDRKGFVCSLNHIPAAECRVAKPEFEARTECRFLQMRGDQKIGFLPFGKRVRYSQENFDPARAELDEFPKDFDSRALIIQPAKDFPVPKNPDKMRTNDPEKGASELIMLSRPPFVASQTYGTPSGISSLSYMVAQLKIDEYNIQFFSSKGVPQYAVILEKMAPPPPKDMIETEDDEEVSDPIAELEQELQEFFTEKLMSSERSVVVVTTFGETTCRFEKLSNDNVDAAFENYEKRAMEMIRLSHNTPGAAIGILDTANLGSGRDGIQMRRYYNHVVLPDQRALENSINHVLRVGRLNPYAQIKLNTLDYEDRKEEEEKHLKRFESGAYSLDDFLEAVGRTPVGPEEGGNLRVIRTAGVTILNQTPDQAIATLAKMQAKQHASLRNIASVVAGVIEGNDD